MMLFDLDAVAPRVNVTEPRETPDLSQASLDDAEAAARDQLRAWALKPHIEAESEGRRALVAAGRLYVEHGIRARWLLCSDDLQAELGAGRLRARVDRILAQAGLEPIANEELPLRERGDE